MKVIATKRTWAVVIALALCLTASLATASAYFTDYKQAKGSVPVTLGAQTEITEDVDGDGIKSVKITNNGETEVFVRVKVFATEQIELGYEAEQGWTQNEDAWYYTAVLAPGDSTTTLKIVPNMEGVDYDKFNVVVAQEAVQAAYDGANADMSLSWKIAGSEVPTNQAA